MEGYMTPVPDSPVSGPPDSGPPKGPEGSAEKKVLREDLRAEKKGKKNPQRIPGNVSDIKAGAEVQPVHVGIMANVRGKLAQAEKLEKQAESMKKEANEIIKQSKKSMYGTHVVNRTTAMVKKVNDKVQQVVKMMENIEAALKVKRLTSDSKEMTESSKETTESFRRVKEIVETPENALLMIEKEANLEIRREGSDAGHVRLEKGEGEKLDKMQQLKRVLEKKPEENPSEVTSKEKNSETFLQDLTSSELKELGEMVGKDKREGLKLAAEKKTKILQKAGELEAKNLNKGAVQKAKELMVESKKIAKQAAKLFSDHDVRMFRLEEKLHKIEVDLTMYSLLGSVWVIPPLVTGGLKVLLGTIQAVAAGILFIPSLFLSALKWDTFYVKHSCKHIKSGVRNVLVGSMEAIFFVSWLLAGARAYRAKANVKRGVWVETNFMIPGDTKMQFQLYPSASANRCVITGTNKELVREANAKYEETIKQIVAKRGEKNLTIPLESRIEVAQFTTEAVADKHQVTMQINEKKEEINKKIAKNEAQIKEIHALTENETKNLEMAIKLQTGLEAEIKKRETPGHQLHLSLTGDYEQSAANQAKIQELEKKLEANVQARDKSVKSLEEDTKNLRESLKKVTAESDKQLAGFNKTSQEKLQKFIDEIAK